MRGGGKILCTLAIVAAGAGIGFWCRPLSYFDAIIYLREALTGVQSRTVSIHGYRIHYLVEGPEGGQAVVLVHGLGGSTEDWRNLAPYLARAGFRIYMPDLPGYGRSQRPRDFSYSVRDQAGIVIGFMDALGLDRVNLGGWSMGGWIVQLVATEQPQRILRLMLFDAAGLDVQPEWDTRLFTPETPQQLDQLDTLLMPHPPHVPGFVANDILRVSAERGWIIKRAMRSMLTGSDVTNKLLPELKMPVVIIWGSADKIFPLEQGQTMHRLISQSQLDVIAGCGHLAPLVCSAAIGPQLVAFLEK